jgi:hypothetical protein
VKLKLRKSLSNWVDVGENTDTGEAVQFLIDYPTLEQQQELDEQRYKYFGADKLNVTKDYKPAEEMTINMPEYLKYKRMLIGFCVKDWRGFPEKCELINGELAPELLNALTRNEEQTEAIFNLIQNEIAFTETDKKK